MINKLKMSKIVLFVIMLIISAISFAPFVWMFLQSFKSEGEFLTNIWSLPSKLKWENYAIAWDKSNFARSFINSAIYTGVSSFVIVFLSLLAGFAFSKLKFWGKEIYYNIIIVNLLIPTVMVLLPIFFLIRDLGLRNSLASMVFPYFTGSVPLCVILVRNYFDGIPNSLIEASKIDGCPIFSIFMKIMLPLSGPITATIGIITAMGVWNDYLWALVALSDKTRYTLSIGLSVLNASKAYYGNTVLFAALVLNSLAIIIIYLIFQRQFISSIIAGAIKE